MLLIFVVVCVVFCFVCIRPVSNCVSDVPSVSGLSILIVLRFSLTFISKLNCKKK